MQILNKKFEENGTTLIELIVSLSIIIVLFLGIYNLIIFSLKITADNKTYVEATEIINQKMEQIRNMPYVEVGTITGSPVGTIPEYETVSRENEYNLHTMIMFYDDPYDGTVSDTDTVITDYKIATIEISWKGRFKDKKITIFSKIIPNTEETLTGYGLLKLFTVDSNGSPVPNANIHIENFDNGLSVDLISDSQGVLSYPVLPGTENYEITVTKTNYGTDKTYNRDAANPNPTRPHLSVFESVKTEESFVIDKLSVLNVEVVSNSQPASWLVDGNSAFNDRENIVFDIDSSDNMYFAWQSKNATSSKIMLQKYNSSETKQWSSPIEIESTNHQKNPDIVTDKSGNTYVVWEDNSVLLKAISFSPSLSNTSYAKNITNIKLDSNFNYRKKSLFDPIPLFTQTDEKKQNIFKIIIDKLKTKSAVATTFDVVFVGAEGASTGNTNIIQIDLPTGVLENDFLLAYIHHDTASDGPIEAPDGWNILNDNLDPSGDSSDSRGNIFWKFADASEPANYSFYTRENCSWSWSWSCFCMEETCSRYNTRMAGNIRAYRNVDNTDPFDLELIYSTTPENNQEHATPSHNVSEDGSMLVCGWGTDTENLGNNSPTIPATFSNEMISFSNRVTAASADKQVGIADSFSLLNNYDANKNVENASINWSLVLRPIIIPDELEISFFGSQIASTTPPTNDFYIGGGFSAIKNNVGSLKIQEINLSENGTIDEENDLANIKIYYDLDSSAPYDCSNEIFDGSETQFGSSQHFDNTSGTSTFHDAGVEVNSTQSACFYVVLDVLNSAPKDSEIKIAINDPSSDIKIDSTGLISPSTQVSIDGETTILKDTELDQIHYRWQNDDGLEDAGTWLASQNIPIQISKTDQVRLRIEIANNGNILSDAVNYQLEFGKKTTSCEAIVSWTPLPSSNSADWEISNSPHLTDGDSTQNIPNGLTDEKTTFLPGEIVDSVNGTSPLVLDNEEFTELLYVLRPTTLTDDSVYCFRLSNAGSVSKFRYSKYPQISIIGDYNIYIRKIDSSGNMLWGTKKVNVDSGSNDQINPSIAHADNSGIQATSSIVWQDYRNGNYDIFLQSFEDNGTRVFASDIQVSNSNNDKYLPDLAIDSNDNIIVAWVENDGLKESIYSQKLMQSGTSIWSSPKVLITSAKNNSSPKLFIDNDNIYLSYTEYDASGKNSYLAKFDLDGNNLWSAEVSAESSTGDKYDSDIYASNNIILTSWTDLRYGNRDIYAQRFDVNGNRQWVNDLKLNITMSATSQEKSRLIINSNDEFYAAWQSDENLFSDLYAKEFLNPSANSPISGVPIIISGTKQIGNNPVILEYSQEHISDINGEITIPLEWDSPGYSFQIASTSPLNIISSSAITPLEILADENKNIILYVE